MSRLLGPPSIDIYIHNYDGDNRARSQGMMTMSIRLRRRGMQCLGVQMFGGRGISTGTRMNLSRVINLKGDATSDDYFGSGAESK